jgi:predicted  nucleic acid-binding Zn-ribbon protein
METTQMIEKQTSLNEVLVRFRADGSVQGAHRVDIERVIDTATGDTLAEKMLPAQPVAADGLEALLGAQAAAMLEQIGQLEADLAAMTHARDDAEADRDAKVQAAEADLAGARAAVEAAEARIAALEAELRPVDENGIPAVVTMADARIVLTLMGLIDRVDAAIASMDGEARIVAATRWEYATHIRRDSAWVTGLGAALGLTPEQIDGLFIAAASLDN